MKPIPTWDEFMVPVLNHQADGEVRALRVLVTAVSDALGLTTEQKNAVLSSGQPVIDNRIGWACSYLYRVGALKRPQKGHYSITDFGRELLNKYPHGITEDDLRKYARSGDEWWLRRNKRPDRSAVSTDAQIDVQPESLDPVEMISNAIELIHGDVKADLINRLTENDPAFFERAVVKLLVAMGYGGTGGRVAATRLVNDGGIDGVIDQDILGLSKVYVQAKRYGPDNPVHRPDVQKFVGALSGKTEQGVFITTGRFSDGAKEYAERDARARIILIDGPTLLNLMIKYRVGVQVRQTVDLVELDEDFFE